MSLLWSFVHALVLTGIISTPLSGAQVTVYNLIPLGQTATLEGQPALTTLAAYDQTILTPPAIPDPAPQTTYTLPVQKDAAAVENLSIPHVGGAFFGFSIEMSVINQVLGKNSSYLQVPFLNLMANIQERAGSVLIRLGGNTQEFATMVDELPNGQTIAKEKAETGKTTDTPTVLYTKDMFYMAANISSLVNVKWFVGIPFNDSTNWRLAIAEYAQAIIGDNLLGMQAGNEPDYYGTHKMRPETYSPYDYYGEIADLIATMNADPDIPRPNILIAPSLESGDWTLEQVWDTGFISAFQDNLYALTIEHYPNNNCYARYGIGSPQDPQEDFKNYLSHDAGIELIQNFLNSSHIAQEAGKPFIMFETNTATCGGFPGISNSYGASLWALDYGMQMAYSNFSNALLHVGGQNVYYNPFTAPPTNQSTYHEWTVGAVYYSALVMAEVFGTTNTSRIVDLWGNAGNIYTPSYAIYENDEISKVALLNYVDDNTGTSDLTVSITVQNGQVPQVAKVKYLASDSVSYRNITWAGQTFGSHYESDGRLMGDLNVVTIACDQTTNTCSIPVPAPGFALVFMQEDSSVVAIGQASATFSTTARTKGGTVTVNPAVLATSNGHSGKDRVVLGSTSEGSAPRAVSGRLERCSGAAAVVPITLGALAVRWLLG